MMKKSGTVLLAALLVFTLIACTSKSVAPQDVLTQKASTSDKTVITVMTRSSFPISVFEKAAEEKFPQLDLVQDGYYTASKTDEQVEKRMQHDDLADVVITFPAEVGEQYFEDRLIDLSAMPFTSKYNTSRLDAISDDGKLYYLPGPSQIRGIVYNKTLFEENGWEVPQDFEGFLALCKTIEASGIRPLQLGLGNPEVLETAFFGYGYANCLSTPEDAQWLTQYNKGEGSFGDQLGPALNTFQTLIDEGILQPSDLEVKYSDRVALMQTRGCAMIEDSTEFAKMLGRTTDSTDELALMPFFNPATPSDWVRVQPVCYVGANKHLQDEGNKEKYDLTMQLLDFMSTPEGQTALIGDSGTMFSSLNGMPSNNYSEVSELETTLLEGRWAIHPTLKNAQGALREGLAGMVAGTLTKEEVAQQVDAENRAPSEKETPAALGSATADFSLTETGNFITDTMRTESGCEIALFLDNGKDGRDSTKGVTAKLYEGDITSADIKRIMPNLMHGEKGELLKVSMTGANLINTLEYSLTVNKMDGWFYYFSGLNIEFAPTAEPGSRVKNITDEAGKQIDPERVYSVAIMDGSVQDAMITSSEETGVLINDLLAKTIQEKKTISPSGSERFVLREP